MLGHVEPLSFLSGVTARMVAQIARSELLRNLDFHRLTAVCEWLNTLPVYMFKGELTASLMLYAYEAADLGSVDHSVRIVLNYQASLEEPLVHESFIELVEQVRSQQPPQELVEFLARDTTH